MPRRETIELFRVPSGTALTFESRMSLGSLSNVKVKSSTRIICLLVVFRFKHLDRNRSQVGTKCLNQTTRKSPLTLNGERRINHGTVEAPVIVIVMRSS